MHYSKLVTCLKLLCSEGDHDIITTDEAKPADEAGGQLKVVQVVDELKPESEEHKDGEDTKPRDDKDEPHVEEGDIGSGGGELSVDVHRESTFCLYLHFITPPSTKVWH